MLAAAAATLVLQSAFAFGPVSDDLRISFVGPNGNTGYYARAPSVAYNPSANEYLAVWGGNDTGFGIAETEIFAQRVSASGALLGDRIRVSDMGPDGNGNYVALLPSVAYNPVNSEYLVVWHGVDNIAPQVLNEFEIFGQRLTAAGAEVGANDFRISDMGPDGSADYDAVFATVAYDSADSRYLVTWQGNDTALEEYEIYGQVLDAAAAPVGTNDFRISTMGPNGDFHYDAYAPNVAYNGFDNEWLVAWRGDDNTAPLVDDEFEIFGQRINHDGAEVGADDFRISDMGPNGNPGYDVAGSSAGAGGSSSGSGRAGAVAFDSVSTQYLVTWAGDDDAAPLVDEEYEVYGQRLDHTAAEVGANDFRISDMGPDGNVNYAAGHPSVAYSSLDKQWLVSWRGDDGVDEEYEVFGQQIDAMGAEIGDNDFRVSHMGPDGSISFGVVNLPALAYNKTDNEYLAVWDADDDTSPSVDDEFEVFGRRLGGGTSGGGGGPVATPTATSTPAASATPTPAFGSNTLVTFRLTTAKVPAAGPVKIQITNANGFAVTGVIYARTSKPVSISRKRVVKLASKSFTIAANAKKTVRLKLPRTLQRLLARAGKLALRVRVTVKDPAGNSRTVNRKVTLKLRTRR